MDGTASDKLADGFRLAVACCRFPGGAQRDAAVISAVRDGVDWPMFLRTVRRHRIAAMAGQALSDAGISVPDEIRSALKQRAQAVAQFNLAMAAETARLQGLLDAASIPSLALKGAALAQLAYGSIAFKFSQDIDIAVPSESRDAAIGVLERAGYRLARPFDARQRELIAVYGREVVLRHPDHQTPVELRWQLVNSPSLLDGVSASSPGQTVIVGEGFAIRTLNDDDMFAYLCVHGAGHGWSRLQWLADLNAYCAGKDEATLLRLYRQAQVIGAGTCAKIGLALCQRLFGIALPAAITDEIDASPRTRLAVAMVLGLLSGPDVTSPEGRRHFTTTRVALMQWLLGAGPRHYASVVGDLCFRLDDMLAWPLPRGLHFLYPLARVPLWLWRRMSSIERPRRETGSA